MTAAQNFKNTITKSLKGSMTALVTPFKQDGEIDWPALDRLIDWQVDQGTHAIIACGTTGESPTLNHDEHARIVERSIERVKGRIPLIAGSGSNSTKEAVDMTRHAKEAGADVALIVAPYYNKPTQEGLYAHYMHIADTVEIPIIVYNIPGRSVVDISVETMARLAQHPNIIGVKDATGDRNRVKNTAAACGADFIQLSGEDAEIMDFMAEGGHGCISVTSNVAPRLCADMHNAWMEGEFDTARAINARLMVLHKALFIETSPQPAKYALSKLGLCTDHLRMPLLPASAKARQAIDEALAALDLLSGGDSAILQAHG